MNDQCRTGIRLPLAGVPAILTVLLTALMLTAGVHAQAAQRHGIPDPITTEELHRYADRLVLSGEQRQMLQSLHDEYRERFRMLRESAIDAYVQSLQEYEGGTSPGSEAWEETESQRNRVLSQIRALDESLFADFEPNLSESQRERLSRVQLARQRARMMPIGPHVLSQTRIVDLSELVFEIDLSNAERGRIDPWLDRYERQLTQMLEALPERIVESRKKFNEFSEAFLQNIRENPELREEAAERLMARHHEAQLLVEEHIVDMRVLGRKTLFEFLPHLSDESARRLREQFVARAYHFTLNHRLRGVVERALNQLLERDDLDPAHRERIEELAQQARHEVERIMREALVAADEFDATTTTYNMMRDRDARREYQNRLNEFGQRIRAVEDQMVMELTGLLEPDASDSFVQALPRNRRRAAEEQSGETRERSHRTEHPGMPSSGGLVPSAISQADVAEYVRVLNLDDEQHDHLRAIHQQYDTRISETADAARREAATRYSVDEGDPEAFVARMADKRRVARAAIEDADRAFFNDLAEAFPEHAQRVTRIRLLRERQRYAIPPMSRMFLGMSTFRGSDAASIDLSRLARRLRVDLAAIPEADEVMLQYERDLTELLREHHEHLLGLADHHAIQLAYVIRQREEREATNVARPISSNTFDDRRETQQQLNATSRAIARLNRSVIDEIVDLLPEDDRTPLLAAYRERAMPQVYRDPGAMENVLTRSLRMDDLDSSQRSQIVELLVEYRESYHEVTEMMRDVVEKQDDARDARERGEGDRDVITRLNEQFGRLRHERQELNARTIVALESILSEEQHARLGSMPDPTARPRPMWMEDMR